MTYQRALTPAESKVLNLVKIFEDATDQKRLAVTVHGNKAAAEAVYLMETKLQVCKSLHVDYIRKEDKYAITFTITEFRRYVEFMVKQVGLTLMLDGSLKTFDNLVITNEYLN